MRVHIETHRIADKTVSRLDYAERVLSTRYLILFPFLPQKLI